MSRAALGGAARGFEQFCDMLVAAALCREVEIAGDHRQQVVEIVRNAAGELADRLHLLRLLHLFFGRLALGHVDEQGVTAARRTVFVAINDHG